MRHLSLLPRIRTHTAILTVMVAAAFWLSSRPAHADLMFTLSATIAPEANSKYLYEYDLSVLPDSTLGASSLALHVAGTADVMMLTGPSGWDSSFSALDGLVLFESPDASFDIPPNA